MRILIFGGTPNRICQPCHIGYRPDPTSKQGECHRLKHSHDNDLAGVAGPNPKLKHPWH